MTFQPKKKLCSACGELTFLWRSYPPTCKDCVGKEKEAQKEGLPVQPRKTLQQKPKARVNGKPVHTALYMLKFGYGDGDFIPSELSGLPCVDVHHVDCRGIGSTKEDDRIENLIGLTRDEHTEYGDKKQYMAFLYRKHMEFMEANGVKFNKEWILQQIEKHSHEVR